MYNYRQFIPTFCYQIPPKVSLNIQVLSTGNQEVTFAYEKQSNLTFGY